MTLKASFQEMLPGAYFADAGQPGEMTGYLRQRGWIAASCSVASAVRAGEGNMNLVLRVQLDDGSSFILKQARPWAEKFPSVAAPATRADVEAEYYRRTAAEPLIAARSPRLLQSDPDSHVLMLEDLGHGADLSRLYRTGAVLEAGTLTALVEYLAVLHRSFRQPACGFVIQNRAMRELNAEHIFRFPFAADTGFNPDAVTPGLAAAAASCRSDAVLMARIRALQQRYLADGDTLLHGDYFPGSILQTPTGIKVIDAEFCFFGDAEFDVGVLIAHLMLAAQSEDAIESVLTHYARAVSGSAAASFSVARCRHYAGIEILRRLLGLAQLPLALDLQAKLALINRARGWLLSD